MVKAYLDGSYPLWLVDALRGEEETDKGVVERYWASQPRVLSDPTWEVLRIEFKDAVSIGEVSLQIATIGVKVEFYYIDRKDRRLPVLDRSLRNFTLDVAASPNRTGWLPVTRTVYPIVAKEFEVRIQRINDPAQPLYSTPVFLKDLLLKRNVFARDDTMLGFERDVDPLGNYITKTVKDWDPKQAIDNKPNTFWKSEPQPHPEAVVAYYLDVRDGEGREQYIDRFYIDPLFTHQSMNVYYSSDDSVGKRRLSTEKVVPVEESEKRVNLAVDPSFESVFQGRPTHVEGAETTTEWSNSGYRSLLVRGSNDGGSAATLTQNMLDGQSLIGETITISATLHITETSAIDGDLARSIYVFDGNETVSQPAPNTPGIYRLHLTTTPQLNPIIRLFNGTDKDVYWDDLLIEKTSELKPYFDGQSNGAMWDGPLYGATSTLDSGSTMDANWYYGTGLELTDRLSSNYTVRAEDFSFDTSKPFTVGMGWSPYFDSINNFITEELRLYEDLGQDILVTYNPVSRCIEARFNSLNGAQLLRSDELDFEEGTDVAWTLHFNEEETVLGVTDRLEPRITRTSETLRRGHATYLSFKNVEGAITAFMIKEGKVSDGVLTSFLQDPHYYLTPDPVLEDEDGRVPSTTLDDVIVGADWRLTELLFGGLDSTFFEEKVWSPIWRDWVTDRRFFYLPVPVTAKYLKFEFTDLTEQPYPIYQDGIDTKWQSFPLHVQKTAQAIADTITTTEVTDIHNRRDRQTDRYVNGKYEASTYKTTTNQRREVDVSAQTTLNQLQPDYEISVGQGVLGELPQSLNRPMEEFIQTEVANREISKTVTNQKIRSSEVITTTKKSTRKVTERVATDAYYTVISGDWLIKIAKKFGKTYSWREIYEANKSLIDNDYRVKLLPKRSPGWWIFPGQKLKVPGAVMKTITKTIQVTEKRLNYIKKETNIRRETTVTGETVTNTSRKRFTDTSIHRYDIKTTKRDTALAYFTGLKELRIYKTNWSAETDEIVYDVPSISIEDFNLTGTKIDDQGTLRVNKETFGREGVASIVSTDPTPAEEGLRVSEVFEAPVGTAKARIKIENTNLQEGQSNRLWVDKVRVTTGSSPEKSRGGLVTHEWLGESHKSVSVKKVDGATTAKNEISNPLFLNNTDGWHKVNLTAETVSSEGVFTDINDYNLKSVVRLENTTEASNCSLRYVDIVAIPGRSVSVSAPAKGLKLRIWIYFDDENGSVVSFTQSTAVDLPEGGVLSHSGVIPEGSSRVRVLLGALSGGSKVFYYGNPMAVIDKSLDLAGQLSLNYFDGDSPSYQENSVLYEWEGEPHASPSVKRVGGEIVARNYHHDPQGIKDRPANYGPGTGGSVRNVHITGASDGPLPEVTSYWRAHTDVQAPSGSGGWSGYGDNLRWDISASAGQYLVLSYYVRYTGPAPETAYTPRIYLFGSSGDSQWSNQAVSQRPAFTSGDWVRIEHVVQAPFDVSSMGFWLYNYGGSDTPSGSTTDITALFSATGSTEQSVLEQAQTYFDGDTPDEIPQNLFSNFDFDEKDEGYRVQGVGGHRITTENDFWGLEGDSKLEVMPSSEGLAGGRTSVILDEVPVRDGQFLGLTALVANDPGNRTQVTCEFLNTNGNVVGDVVGATSRKMISYSTFQRLESEVFKRPHKEQRLSVIGHPPGQMQYAGRVSYPVTLSGESVSLVTESVVINPLGSHSVEFFYLAEDLSWDASIEALFTDSEGNVVHSESFTKLATGKWSKIKTVPTKVDLDGTSITVRVSGSKGSVYINGIAIKSSTIRILASNDDGENWYDITKTVDMKDAGYVFSEPGRELRVQFQLNDPDDYVYGFKLWPSYLPIERQSH